MRYITIILIALLCAACSSALPSLKPYRMDIQQGNVVTSKMMLQLRPGMTKSQVRFIMGTPLIQDSFHANRWDYFYQMRKDGKIIEQRRVILEFENDALKQVRGDVIPAGTGEAVADPSPVTESPKSGKKKEKKGLLDRLKFWGDEPEQEKPQEAPAELISPAAVPSEPASAKPAEKVMPEESAQPAQETPKQEQAPTEEAAPVQPAEGMPEPGAPLGPEPKDLEKGTAPPVETPQAREIEETPQPAEPQAEPAPAAKPASAPEPVKSAPAESEPVVEQEPAKTEAPKAEPAPQSAPAKQTKPAPQRKPAPEPEPDDEGLPPEDDPGYFERMLEKIGF